ncbi:MAG: hypothetical protein ACR2QM_05240 [Longimicrobiales bacterium]
MGDVRGLLGLSPKVRRAARGGLFAGLCIAAWGCASTPNGGESTFDPTGIYDVTMATQGLVSEGTMTIRGVPGDYRGTLDAGGVSAEIHSVEVGEDNLNVQAQTTRGVLILRLARDGGFLSGNWVLADRRGTFSAELRP